MDFWLGSVCFHGMSISEGHLMPNPFYTFILNTCFHNTFCRLTFLNEPVLILFY